MRRLARVPATWLALVSLGSGASSLTAQQAMGTDTVRVLVRVVDGISGEGVAGALLIARPDVPGPGSAGIQGAGGRTGEVAEGGERAASATTDEAGEAALSLPRAALIEASAAGYVAAARSWNPGDPSTVVLILEPRPLELPDIAVRTRGGRIGTVRTLDLRTAGGRSLSDRLRDLPSFAVRDRGPGQGRYVTVRGSRPEAVAVTLDGVPINDPLTGRADLSLLPEGTLETAAAWAGSGGSTGWGGTAGTLTLQTRRPSPGVRVRALAGSFGRRAAGVEAGWVGPRVELGLAAGHERATNDFPFYNRVAVGDGRERRRNADYETTSLLARGRLKSASLSVVARVDEVERGAPGRMGNHLWDRARWRERAFSIGSAYGPEAERDEPGDASVLRVSVAWSGRTQEYVDPARDRHERTTARQALVTGSKVLSGGLEFEWRAVWAGLHGSAVAGSPERIHGGVRVGWRRRLGDSWVVQGGMGGDGAREGLALSPALAVEWTPGPAWKAWLRAGQARRLPTFADLFLRPGTGARPNPDLVPERVLIDAEIGAEVRPGDGLRLRSSVFMRETRDPIIWIPSVVGIWSPRNAGRLHARGLELQADWSAETGWWARASAALQASRVRFGSSTGHLPYEPGVRGRFGLGRRWGGAGRGGGVELGLEVSGPRRTAAYGPHELQPFALLDIRAHRTFTVGDMIVEADAGVLNALDTTYERMELFPEPGRRFELRFEVGPLPSSGLPAADRDGTFQPSASGGGSPDDAGGVRDSVRPGRADRRANERGDDR